MSDEQEIKLACLHQAGGNLDHAKDLFAWVAGTSTAERQRDELFAETKRAQAIIDGLRPHRDLVEYLSILDDPEEADDWASGVQAFAKVIREAKQIFGVTAALDTISALTPPLQHKGGETEAGVFDDGEAMREASTLPPGARYKTDEEIRASVRPVWLRYPASEGWKTNSPPKTYTYFSFLKGVKFEMAKANGERVVVESPGPMVEFERPVEDVEAYRILTTSTNSEEEGLGHTLIGMGYGDDDEASEADSGPWSSLAQGDARIEPPISTLQASSGEGETIPEGFTKWYGVTEHHGDIRDVLGIPLHPDWDVEVINQRGQTAAGKVGEMPWSHDGSGDDIVAYRVLGGVRLPEASGPTLVHSATPIIPLDPEAGWRRTYDAKIADGCGHTAAAEVADFYWKYPIEAADARLDDTPELTVIKRTDTPTEPAAYSPVNNADEPFIDDTVAGSFARGKDRELELAAEADAVEQVKTAEAKRFGSIFNFGKPKALVGEGA